MKKFIKNLSSILYIFTIVWKKNKSYYFFYIIHIIISSFNSICSIILTQKLLNNLVIGDKKNAIIYSILLVFSLFLFEIICKGLNVILSNKISKINHIFKKELFQKLNDLPFFEINKKETIDNYQKTKEYLNNSGVNIIMNRISSIVSSLITLIGLLYLLKNLNAIIIIIIILSIIINSLCEIRRLNINYEDINWKSELEEELSFIKSILNDDTYAKEIQLFNMYDYITIKTKELSRKFSKMNKKRLIGEFKLVWWTYGISMLSTIIIYGFIFYEYISNSLMIGDFTLYIGSVIQLNISLQLIITSIIKITEQSFYITKYRDFDNILSDMSKVDIDTNSFEVVEFKNVSFKYPDEEKFVLKNINLKICKNQKISFVGENGSGKTTFIKLLMRLYEPTEGAILINGIDIRKYTLDSYYKLFSTVFQDYLITGFKIKDNISYQIDKDIKKIYDTICKIGLEDIINRFSEKENSYISTKICSEGIGLSGGEEQKLAIARALYKNGEIFILDEPTSALSPQSEYDIYKKFNNITKNKTVIFISHRLSSCKLAEIIYVFNKGEIIEKGSHQELINLKGKYYDMFKLQSDLYLEVKK